MDKHRTAHDDLHRALRDIIQAIELMQGLVAMDRAAHADLSRILTRARMSLSQARQDMRYSRLGG